MTRRLRITYVVHQFLPRFFTGTEQYVFATAKAMQARGHDVEVVALEPDFRDRSPVFEQVRDTVDGLPIVRLQYWYSLGRDFAQLDYHHPWIEHVVGAYLDARAPDLVHVFHAKHLGAGILDEAAVRGIATVVHLMDFWFLCANATLLRADGSLCDGPRRSGADETCTACMDAGLASELRTLGVDDELRRFARHAPAPTVSGWRRGQRATTHLQRADWLRERLERADAVVAPSRFLASTFAANGIDRRIDTISYGVDPDRLGGRTAASRTPRRETDPLRLAFIGSIADHKGTDLVVDAVLASTAPVQLTVHGRATDFPDYAQDLIARADADDRIRFSGPFERDRLGAVLADTDVLVVPSRWYENTPFVVLEAFAAGVPVLATALGGLAEIIVDEAFGELFARDDVDDLRRRIQRLAAEPARLEAYRLALPTVKTMAENADEIARLYERVVRREGEA